VTWLGLLVRFFSPNIASLGCLRQPIERKIHMHLNTDHDANAVEREAVKHKNRGTVFDHRFSQNYFGEQIKL
jgi:hypothetical protein